MSSDADCAACRTRTSGFLATIESAHARSCAAGKGPCSTPAKTLLVPSLQRDPSMYHPFRSVSGKVTAVVASGAMTGPTSRSGPGSLPLFILRTLLVTRQTKDAPAMMIVVMINVARQQAGGGDDDNCVLEAFASMPSTVLDQSRSKSCSQPVPCVQPASNSAAVHSRPPTLAQNDMASS